MLFLVRTLGGLNDDDGNNRRKCDMVVMALLLEGVLHLINYINSFCFAVPFFSCWFVGWCDECVWLGIGIIHLGIFRFNKGSSKLKNHKKIYFHWCYMALGCLFKRWAAYVFFDLFYYVFCLITFPNGIYFFLLINQFDWNSSLMGF